VRLTLREALGRLFDNRVAIELVKHPLRAILMAHNDGEAECASANRRIFGACQLEVVGAGEVAALAEEAQQLPVDGCAVPFNRLVRGPEAFLCSDTLRGAHEGAGDPGRAVARRAATRPPSPNFCTTT
jgi:hypothetical protein